MLGAELAQHVGDGRVGTLAFLGFDLNGGQELVLAIKNRIGHVLQGEDGRPGILQSVESRIVITALVAVRTHHHLNFFVLHILLRQQEVRQRPQIILVQQRLLDHDHDADVARQDLPQTIQGSLHHLCKVLGFPDVLDDIHQPRHSRVGERGQRSFCLLHC